MSGPVVRTRSARVFAFLGPYPEPAAVEVLARLEAHPELELVGAVAEDRDPGAFGLVRDVWRRRRWLAPPVVLGLQVERLAWWVRRPRRTFRLVPAARRALARVDRVPDVHAPEVLERIRGLKADIGLIYGGPILRPELFEIPRLGTLGIHHGRLPAYRGKKTTFWEVYRGEEEAGVTIQRLNAGLDTGDIVAQGLVPVARKRYGRVWHDVQALGVELCIECILAMVRGTAAPRPQEGEKGPLYRDPGWRDMLTLWLRQVGRWSR